MEMRRRSGHAVIDHQDTLRPYVGAGISGRRQFDATGTTCSTALGRPSWLQMMWAACHGRNPRKSLARKHTPQDPRSTVCGSLYATLPGGHQNGTELVPFLNQSSIRAIAMVVPKCPANLHFIASNLQLVRATSRPDATFERGQSGRFIAADLHFCLPSSCQAVPSEKINLIGHASALRRSPNSLT
jgi:hypothetical protein